MLGSHFRWNRITDEQLEELLYALLLSQGAARVTWRQGPGDKGRDVEAVFRTRDGVGEMIEETFFAEAKHHTTGVSAVDVAGALAWAQAEHPDALIFATSSHLTTPCREHVAAWSRNNPRVRIVVWERPELENRILSNRATRSRAVGLGLLPPEIADLLPPSPEQFRTRPRDAGLEMEYRYWIAESELEKIDQVVRVLEELGSALRAALGDATRHFDLTELAVPNWTTWLRLLKAQLHLQLAVRDYLYALATQASTADVERLAKAVKAAAVTVQDVGDVSSHVD